MTAGSTLRLIATLLSVLAICNAAGAEDDAARSRPARHSAALDRRKVQQKDRKFFKFVTRPDIDAPNWNLKVYDKNVIAPGYWFIAPYQELDQGTPGDAWVGPHIYDSNGELIWSGSGMFQHWNAFDFEMTEIDGQQMMTILYPHGKAGIILDSNYQIFRHVPFDSVRADMHAFRVIDNGRRALVITHEHMQTSVSEAQAIGVHGNCSVASVGFAELLVDDPSKPLFEWHAHGHIRLEETTYNTNRLQYECEHNWDILHVNAIDKFPDGDYLISARHTDTLYKISSLDGSIVWRLGGIRSDFHFIGPGNPTFSRQHHALVHSQQGNRTTISLFDNAVGTGEDEHESNTEARGLLLLLDTAQMTAGVVAEYKHPRGHTVSSRGSFQTLPNGNAFICWTYSSYISEHAPNGTVVMEAILPVAAHSYRAFKYQWKGRPAAPPDVVSEAIATNRNEVHTMVYVSWNGATEVRRWALHRASANGEIEDAAIVIWPREGFETNIRYDGVAEYVMVVALGRDGEKLGKSSIVRTIPLAEQGLIERPHAVPLEQMVAKPSQEMTAVVESVPKDHSSLLSFSLGFALCAVGGCILLWLSRWQSGSARIWSGRGVKYDLLLPEHLQ